MGRGDCIASALFEGIWIPDVEYLKATLRLLGQGLPVSDELEEESEEAEDDESVGKAEEAEDDVPNEPQLKKRRTEEVNHWPKLPEEIILGIFGMVERDDLLSLAETDTVFRKLSNSDVLWVKFYERWILKDKMKKRDWPDRGGKAWSLKGLIGQFPVKHLWSLEKQLRRYSARVGCKRSDKHGKLMGIVKRLLHARGLGFRRMRPGSRQWHDQVPWVHHHSLSERVGSQQCPWA